MKKLRVTVEGKVYEVLVEVLDEGAPAVVAARPPAPVAATPAPAPVAAPSAPAAAPAPVARPSPAAARAPVGAGDIIAPLSGKVVSFDVKVGDPVAEGAQVATIVAMKMNTYIFAHRGGKVAALLAAPGDGVEEGAALLRLED